jgi:hypothetical protein
MRGLQRIWLSRTIISVLFLSGCLPVEFAQAAAPPVPAIARRAAPHALRVQVRPGQIKVGRDVALAITVNDAKGKGLTGALVAVNGAGAPRIGTTHKGSVSLMVHAMGLGKATLLATYKGYAPITLKLPIVPGSPATVAAITGGVKILAPKQKPVGGKVGADLFAQYDAVTAARQFASLGLRDGTLVDLNAGTDVRIQDPLHTRLNQGEVFLEVVHGAASHQIQVGSAVAATKGTRLDVRYNRASHVSTVIVVEGRVQVQNKGKAVLVGAGQQTTVAGTAPPSRPVRVDLASRLSWLHNLPNSTSSGVVPPVLNLPVPPLVPVASPSIASTPTMTITSALESTTWSGVVRLDGGVTVPVGTAVTIQPGTVVAFTDSSWISVKGVMRSAGTAAAPIIFTSIDPSPQPGAWDYLDFSGPGTSGSVLNYVNFFYGGYNGTSGAELSFSQGASGTVSNCVAAQSIGDGIYVDDDATPTISGCLFAGNTNYAVSTGADSAALISGSRLGANQNQGIQVRGTTMTHSGTWHRQDVPWVLDGGVKLAAGARLDVDAGTVLLMNDSAWFSISGSLLTHGTAGAPVIVTSSDPAPQPGAWDYLDFTGPSANASILDHTEVFYGGYNGSSGAEVSASNGASPTISNSVFAQSIGAGLYLDTGDRAVVKNCTFANNAGYAISTTADDSTLITGTTTATGQTGIEVRGDTISHGGAWHAQQAPFILGGGVTLAAAATLSIDAGTVILMHDSAWFEIHGTLLAGGTASAPIVVTSEDPQPARGAWDYWDFSGPSASGGGLDYVQVSYGGYNGSSGAEVSASNGASPTIGDSGFSQSIGVGLYLDDGSRSVVRGCVFEQNASYGISTPADDAANISQSATPLDQPGIRVRGTAISHSGTWQAQGAPYVLDGGVTLTAGVTITVQPGTLIQMTDSAWLSVRGTLLARGSANAPIIITSADAHPAPGAWDYWDFSGPSASGSVLDYVQVSYGGYNGSSGAEVSASNGATPTITHCLIASSIGDGIYVDSGQPVIAFNTFQQNASAAISIPAKDPAHHVHDNQFVGNQKGLEVRG